jgi:Tol biopolymer transport system component
MKCPVVTKALSFRVAAPAAVLLVLACSTDDACDTSNPLMPVCPRATVFATPAEPHIVFQSNRDGNFEIYTMNSDGTNVRRLTNTPQADLNPSWSPDGTEIVFTSERDGNREVYIMNADGSDVRRLTNDPALDGFPALSPDGRHIAFHSLRIGNQSELFIMDRDGSNVRRLTDHPAQDVQPRWSPRGDRITFVSTRPGTGQIFLIDPDGTGLRLLTMDGTNQLPTWSPDGRRMAFAAARMMDMIGSAVNFEIYTMWADGSAQVNISRSAGLDTAPIWSRNGLIYFASDRTGTRSLWVMNPDGSDQRQVAVGQVEFFAVK